MAAESTQSGGDDQDAAGADRSKRRRLLVGGLALALLLGVVAAVIVSLGGDERPTITEGEGGLFEEGRQVRGGSFQPLRGAPAAYQDLTGAARLITTPEGAMASLELVGLEPGTAYEAHVHAESCDRNKGGPHFKFDPDGSDLPPNEIHFDFRAESDGSGRQVARTRMTDTAGARSIVVHLGRTRIACADLS